MIQIKSTFIKEWVIYLFLVILVFYFSPFCLENIIKLIIVYQRGKY